MNFEDKKYNSDDIKTKIRNYIQKDYFVNDLNDELIKAKVKISENMERILGLLFVAKDCYENRGMLYFPGTDNEWIKSDDLFINSDFFNNNSRMYISIKDADGEKKEFYLYGYGVSVKCLSSLRTFFEYKCTSYSIDYDFTKICEFSGDNLIKKQIAAINSFVEDFDIFEQRFYKAIDDMITELDKRLIEKVNDTNWHSV